MSEFNHQQLYSFRSKIKTIENGAIFFFWRLPPHGLALGCMVGWCCSHPHLQHRKTMAQLEKSEIRGENIVKKVKLDCAKSCVHVSFCVRAYVGKASVL